MCQRERTSSIVPDDGEEGKALKTKSSKLSKLMTQLNPFKKKRIDPIYRRGSLPPDAKWYILDPKNPFQQRWDILIISLLVFTAFVTPYEVAFLESELDALFFINRFIDLAFVVDICINFVAAEFDEYSGVWRYKFSIIAKRYLRTWFPIDLVSVLPFDVIGLASDSETVTQLKIIRVIRLFRLLKLLRMFRAKRIFARWENKISVSYSVLSLLKFIVAVITFAHWMSCAWRIVPDIEQSTDIFGDPISWIHAQEVEQASPGTQYIISLYWSVMTITTIGYGDIVPVTSSERLVAVISMLMGVSIYAYVVGAVCGIVSGMDEATNEFHNSMDQLNRYMKEYRIPEPLRLELRAYFQHCRHLVRERHYRNLLHAMSPHLRGRVALHCHSIWISKIPFFNSPSVSSEERKGFLIEVAMALEPEAFGPQESIVRINMPAKELFIVQKGVVAKQGTIINRGGFFGEDMILTNYKRPYIVNTLTYVDVFKLTRDSLQEIVKHNEFPATKKQIRKAAVVLAFQKKFTAMAHAVSAFLNNGGKKKMRFEDALSPVVMNVSIEKARSLQRELSDIRDRNPITKRQRSRTDGSFLSEVDTFTVPTPKTSHDVPTPLASLRESKENSAVTSKNPLFRSPSAPKDFSHSFRGAGSTLTTPGVEKKASHPDKSESDHDTEMVDELASL